jgi:hypothetical protein
LQDLHDAFCGVAIPEWVLVFTPFSTAMTWFSFWFVLMACVPKWMLGLGVSQPQEKD